ncbi:MAG: hypothetical protein AAF653_20815, partial [Chloroflexota bacterium]
NLMLPPAEAAIWLQNNAREDASIVGSHLYYLWLYDFDYTSSHLPATLRRNYGGNAPDAVTLWAEIEPDYIIVDRESPGWMRPQSVIDYLESNDYSLWMSFDNADIYQRPE